MNVKELIEALDKFENKEVVFEINGYIHNVSSLIEKEHTVIVLLNYKEESNMT